MDWPTAAVAIAASAATSGVAIYALVQQGRNAAKDRAHDRDMRRTERRATAYVELLTALERQQMQVERTAPIFVEGQPPEPPPPLSDEELWRLNALAEVIASDALRAKIEAWTDKPRQFFNDVLYLRQVQAHQQGRRPSETKEALDRYFGAFEQGIMSAADCQERIACLRDRIEALEAEERTIVEGGPNGLSTAPTADDVAEWARDLRVLIESATPQQKKALIRLLVKELRVMSRKEILPTYKIPALVRAPEGRVDVTGQYSNSLAAVLRQLLTL